MKNTKLEIIRGIDHFGGDDIAFSIKKIRELLQAEIANQQQTIQFQQEEIKRLRKELTNKDQVSNDLQIKMIEVQQKAEGNRQLVNKLLNDMERMQQDLGWYKRTYESRSLLGTIREKLFK